MSRPSVSDMLAAIGWRQREINGHPCAEDIGNDALRISNQWGNGIESMYRCGSRGPRGTWARFDEAVTAAYRYHVGPSEAERLRALVAELEYDLTTERATVAALQEDRNRLAAEMESATDILSALYGDAHHAEQLARAAAPPETLAVLAERAVTMGKAAMTRAQRLAAEVGELREALANERGEGAPPSEGWTPDPVSAGRWEHADGRVCFRVRRAAGLVYIVVQRGAMGPELACERTARSAMRAATKSLEGK
jgi:hypothetical protein